MKQFKIYSSKDLIEMPKPPSQWRIIPEGMECKENNYFIAANRLHELGWLFQMAEKREWIDMADFVECFFTARNYHFPTIYPSVRDIRDGCADKKPTRKDRSLNLAMRFRILHRDGFCCQLCGTSAQNGSTLEVDHKRSVKDGGSDAESNLWTLCFDCNRGKGSVSL